VRKEWDKESVRAAVVSALADEGATEFTHANFYYHIQDYGAAI